MESSTVIWLSLTVAAPLTLVPQVAFLRLLHSKRKSWHPLDVLVVSLLVSQLCCTLAALALSGSALLASSAGLPHPICTTLISFWAAAHTLHAATVASVAVDRAMTVRWPYKYRLDVRRTQIRYHVVVLAIVSALVGVAALFANSSSSSNSIEQLQPVWSAAEGCAFLPYLFDSRFALFWLCLHGVLFLATVASMMAIVITRLVMHRDITIPSPLRVPAASSMTVPAMSKTTYVKMHGSQESVQTSESAGPAAPSTTGGGGGPLAASASSTAVHQTSRWNAHRHWTAAAVLTVTYLTHHLPLLVLTTLGTYFESFLPGSLPWPSMVLASLLVCSLLTMAILVIVDPVLRTWMKHSLRPSSKMTCSSTTSTTSSRRTCTESTTLDNVLHPFGGSTAALHPPGKIDEETHCYHNQRLSQSIYSLEPSVDAVAAANGKPFPLTNGSLFAHLMNPATNDARANRRPSRMGVSAYHPPVLPQRPGSAVSSCRSSSNSIILRPPEEAKPALLTFMSRSKILAANQQQQQQNKLSLGGSSDLGAVQQEVEPHHQEGGGDCLPQGVVSSGSATFVRVKHVQQQPEPIYASLSETLGSSFNTLDDDIGNATVEEDDSDDDDEVGSATESAGDDFEFHNIRTSRLTLVSESAAPPSPTTVVFGLEDLKPRSRIARSATYRILCNGLDVKCAKRGEEPEQPLTEASSQSQHGVVTCKAVQQLEDMRPSLMMRSKLLTSLSMNDIDVCCDDQPDHHPHQSVMMNQSTEQLPIGRNEAAAIGDRPMSLFSLHHPPVTPPHDEQSAHLRSSIEISKGRSRKPGRPSLQQRQEQQEQHLNGNVGLFQHYRKKSSNLRRQRSRAAVLQRFQQRNSESASVPAFRTGAVVSIAALKAALTQSPVSYLDNGDVYLANGRTVDESSGRRTVFVSEYI